MKSMKLCLTVCLAVLLLTACGKNTAPAPSSLHEESWTVTPESSPVLNVSPSTTAAPTPDAPSTPTPTPASETAAPSNAPQVQAPASAEAPATVSIAPPQEEPAGAQTSGTRTFYDAIFGLRLDAAEPYASGIDCNTMTFCPFAFYEPTSNAALSGGGKVWLLEAFSYEEFLNTYGQDGSEWTTASLGAEEYMLGRTEDYVFVLSFPSDTQYTEATQAAYQDYRSAGYRIVSDFLSLNGIEANPDWQSFYPG